VQVTVTLIALPAWPLDAHGAGEHHTLTAVAQRVTLPEGARVADLLQALGVRVERIEVTELRDGTFYAEIVMRRDDDRVVRVSSRPSDAIALAARLGTPIYAAEAVLDEAGVPFVDEDEQEEEVEKFREFLQNVDPEDFAS